MIYQICGCTVGYITYHQRVNIWKSCGDKMYFLFCCGVHPPTPGQDGLQLVNYSSITSPEGWWHAPVIGKRPFHGLH